MLHLVRKFFKKWAAYYCTCKTISNHFDLCFLRFTSRSSLFSLFLSLSLSIIALFFVNIGTMIQNKSDFVFFPPLRRQIHCISRREMARQGVPPFRAAKNALRYGLFRNLILRQNSAAVFILHSEKIPTVPLLGRQKFSDTQQNRQNSIHWAKLSWQKESQ